MQKRQYGKLAFLFLVMSIAAFVYKQGLSEQQSIWLIIPQLLLLASITWAIPYTRSSTTQKRFLMLSTFVAFGCAAYQIQLFWTDTTILMSGLLGVLVVLAINNLVYYKLSRLA